MDARIFDKLFNDGMIDTITHERIKVYERDGAVSVYWDLLTLLYAGIFFLTTGIGIIIYKNIDSIGHVAITSSIALATLASFFYCLRKAKGFKTGKVEPPNVWFDYIFLLGCLLMLILTAYLQFQYQVFGTRWGLATFFPMVILFLAAYYFDHIGVLSLAITNLATWVGITVTPTRLLKENDFDSTTIIYTGILLGALLILAGLLSIHKNIKSHFGFTYKNFGSHLLFVSTLSAVFNFSHSYLLWFLLLFAISFYQFREAVKHKSFYFLVITAIYFYIGLSYVAISNFFKINARGDAGIYLSLFYLIFSGLGLVIFLLRYNKILKQHAGV